MHQSTGTREPSRKSVVRFSEQRRRTRRYVYLLLIALAGGLGAASIWRVEPLLSANDRSRWATVRALEEFGTYRIDEVIQNPRWDTIDKVRHEGHFYSTKPALLPTLVAYVSRGVNRVTDYYDGPAPDEASRHQHDGWTLADEPVETTRAVLTIVNLVPWLIALAALAGIVERFARRDVTRAFILATAALGTMLSPFLVTLNNHLIAAVSVVCALYPAMRIVVDEERQWWLFAMAGFFAAFACTNELPAALFGVLLFGLLVWKAPKPTLLVFVPAALIPLAGFFYTNYLATGGWKPFYAYYGTEKYEYVHKGVPSYWTNPGGIDANEEPPLVYLLHCTVGHHGIFSLSPIFLLSVVGWIGMAAWDDKRRNLFLWMGLVLTLAVLGFYLSRTENYNYGGNTAGLRWTFWLIPFWLIAMIPVFDRFGKAVLFRGISAVLLLVSVFSATYALDNPWQQPWLYRVMERYEWIDYRTPAPPSPFRRPVTSWFPSLPKKAGAWVRFEGFDTRGNRVELRLEDGGVFPDNEAYRIVNAEWFNNGEESSRMTLLIHAKRFHSGRFPAECLAIEPGETDQQRRRKLTFLRGLPLEEQRAPRVYNIGKVDYVFNSHLREDAFECRRSSARVPFLPAESAIPLSGQRYRNWYRCDAWLTDDVPFGVLQVTFRTFDGETGRLLSAVHLQAVETSRTTNVDAGD